MPGKILCAFHKISFHIHQTGKTFKSITHINFWQGCEAWKLPGTAGESRRTIQSNLAKSGQVEDANISFSWTFREIYTYTQEFSEEPHL